MKQAVVIGREYMFFQEDTGGQYAAGCLQQCGKRVRVLNVADCHDCWDVQCVDGGKSFIAYREELRPLESVPLFFCSGLETDISAEDKVIALVSEGCVEASKHYVVRSINQDGTLNLSKWRYDLGTVLPGTYDPACFRKVRS